MKWGTYAMKCQSWFCLFCDNVKISPQGRQLEKKKDDKIQRKMSITWAENCLYPIKITFPSNSSWQIVSLSEQPGQFYLIAPPQWHPKERNLQTALPSPPPFKFFLPRPRTGSRSFRKPFRKFFPFVNTRFLGTMWVDGPSLIYWLSPELSDCHASSWRAGTSIQKSPMHHGYWIPWPCLLAG